MLKHNVRFWVLKATVVGLVGAASSSALTQPGLAQNAIIPDATLGGEASIVSPIAPFLPADFERIDGGAVRGQNLFHSFAEFNINETGAALFITPSADIANIFTRITGGNPSEILGILGTRQANFSMSNADLFLINPNGIIFGENSALDVGGSFTATTASGVQFGDLGAFSATAPESPTSLLTIAPSAYFFNAAAADIIIESNRLDNIDRTTRGLRVPDAENLTILGGKIEISGRNNLSGIHARGGNIQIGSSRGSGTISLDSEGKLVLPDLINRNDITINDNAIIDSALNGGNGNGNITLAGQNITLRGQSFIRSGILVGENPEARSGNIVLNATDAIQFSEQSALLNQVNRGAFGDAGTIYLSAQVLEILGFGTRLSASTSGRGNAGNIVIDIEDLVTIDGGELFSRINAGGVSRADSEKPSEAGGIDIKADQVNLTGAFLATGTRSGGDGNSGNIIFDVNSLRVDSGTTITTSTFGRGDSGDVIINALGEVVFEGSEPNPDGNIFRTAVFTNIETTGQGNGGDIIINAESVRFLNRASLFTNIGGQGDHGGDIIINTGSLLLDAAQFQADVSGRGNSGNIIVNASGDVTLKGRVEIENEGIFGSLFNTSVEQDGIGNGGNITISARNLTLLDGGQLQTDTEGQGNAGSINLNISENIVLSGTVFGTNSLGGLSLLPSGFVSTTEQKEGRGGDIVINTQSLLVNDGANIRSESLLFSRGDAGNISISAKGSIILDGLGLAGIPSRISSAAIGFLVGQGGEISIEADSVIVRESAEITSETFSISDARGGRVSIFSNSLDLETGGRVTTSTLGFGRAGDISLTIVGDLNISSQLPESLSPPFRTVRNSEDLSSGIFAVADQGSLGDAGNINVQAGRLTISSYGFIASLSRGLGSAGNILIQAPRVLLNNGNILAEATNFIGGDIQILGDQIQLVQDSDIISSVLSGQGSGGNIFLRADSFIIALGDSDILAFATEGRGGNITLQTPGFFGENFTLDSLTADPATLDGNDRVDINATGTVNGVVTIPNISFIENSLVNLQDVIVDTNALTTGSCIARTEADQGRFVNTGSGGLPARPGDSVISTYPTGNVQSLPSIEEPQAIWQPGDPIVEPTGVFSLPDGRLVLARECGEN